MSFSITPGQSQDSSSTWATSASECAWRGGGEDSHYPFLQLGITFPLKCTERNCVPLCSDKFCTFHSSAASSNPPHIKQYDEKENVVWSDESYAKGSPCLGFRLSQMRDLMRDGCVTVWCILLSNGLGSLKPLKMWGHRSVNTHCGTVFMSLWSDCTV